MSVNSRQDKILSAKNNPEPESGTVVNFNINSIWSDFVLGEFKYRGNNYKAKIIKSPDLEKNFNSLLAGEHYKVKLINCDSTIWIAELI